MKKTYNLKINGTDYEVCINGIADGKADVTVDGVSYDVQICGTKGSAPVPSPAGQSDQVDPIVNPRPTGNETGCTITSPLPGIVLRISVNVGDRVKRGQQVAVIEAMKMENEILSETDGVVRAIFVTRGDSILEGEKIISIE